MWIYTSTPYTTSWRSASLVKHRDNFTFYLTGNTLRHHYGDQSVIDVWAKKTAVYCENHTKRTNTLRDQTEEF
jgi:hypothetical protein